MGVPETEGEARLLSLREEAERQAQVTRAEASAASRHAEALFAQAQGWEALVATIDHQTSQKKAEA